MQIKINLKIFVFVILFCITNQIELYVILMLFAFLHELGHLFSGLLLGCFPKSITISPVGISILFKAHEKDYNKKIKNGNLLALKKLIIALSGPMVNMFFIIVFLVNEFDFFGISRDIIIYSNFLIGIFNLLPIYPLDGGRILKNLLHMKVGLRDTYRYVNNISNIVLIVITFFSSFLILYLENISVLIIIFYLWYLVIIENNKYMEKQRMYEIVDKYYNKDSVCKIN